MFWTIFILATAFIGIALVGLGIQTFFTRRKAFPETRVGHNKQMRKRKISCIKTQQITIDKEGNYKRKNKNKEVSCEGC